jgi:hypothetical protein
MTSHNAILVANSAVARLFDRRSLKEPWVETQDWWHGESRMQARDLEPLTRTSESVNVLSSRAI